MVRPGSGQPHRRAHRLQRRPRPAHRPAPADRMPPCGRRADDVAAGRLGAARRDGRGRARRDPARDARGLGGLRRRGAVGAARARATTSAASTSPSTARCRSGPGCPARPLWSARSARRARDLFGLDLLDGDESRSRLAAACRRAENDIAGRHRRDGPGRLPALPRRPRRCSWTAGPGGSSTSRSTSTRHDLVLLVIDTRAEHALVDGQYADRRQRLRGGRRPARGRDACANPARPDSTRRSAGSSGRVLRQRARHVVTEIDRVERARRRPARRTTSTPSARLLHRLPRLAARRLRGELPRARRRRRGGARRRRARRPDDRRRVRWLGHRAGPAEPRARVAAAVRTAYRRTGFTAPAIFAGARLEPRPPRLLTSRPDLSAPAAGPSTRRRSLASGPGLQQRLGHSGQRA